MLDNKIKLCLNEGDKILAEPVSKLLNIYTETKIVSSIFPVYVSLVRQKCFVILKLRQMCFCDSW